ncbi:MAG: HAMP domain-containing sensor histidine kinase [Myxococcota bacterium]
MRTDPNTKRARDVVWLVVFTVALPSLLLTALGAVAVKNEEAAALARLEALYTPTMDQVADAFNATLDETVDAAAVPLRELVMISDAPEARAEAVERFRGRFDFVTNFYVLDSQGELRVPRTLKLEEESCLDASSTLPERLVAALRAQEVEAISPSCSELAAIAASGDQGIELGCAAMFAQVSCQVAGGEISVAKALEMVCPSYAEHPATALVLELKSSRRLYRTPSPGTMDKQARREPSLEQVDVEALGQKRRRLFELLSDPVRATPPYFTEVLARDVMSTLTARASEIQHWRWRVGFHSIATRPQMLSELRDVAYPWDAETAISAHSGAGWRRVSVRRAIEGDMAGFELVAPLLEPVLQDTLVRLGLGDDLYPLVASIDMPLETIFPRGSFFDEARSRLVNSAFSKKSELSWHFGLAMASGSTFFNLHRSRSTLYFWALVLMATALVFGLAYTVWAVIREARLSRLKTDFVSSVSHDLRTPLTSIRMFTEMLLLGRVRGREEERECLEVIAKETERLTRLTERILDFSRMEAGRKAYSYEPIEVRPIIDEALEACRPLMAQGEFDVVVDIEDGLARMCADRDAMIEVLMNLMSNAIKYSPGMHYIAVRARREGRHIAIAVEDRGMGIPKPEMKRIFEKFHRVDCRRTCEVSGSGIGLSLVEHIVHAHEGEVAVKSTPGRGSTFTVRVPAEVIQSRCEAVEGSDGANSGYRGRPIDSPGAV